MQYKLIDIEKARPSNDESMKIAWSAACNITRERGLELGPYPGYDEADRIIDNLHTILTSGR